MGYGKLQNGYGKSSIEKYFKACDDIDFLDAIDYFFYLIDKKIRTIKPEGKWGCDRGRGSAGLVLFQWS